MAVISNFVATIEVEFDYKAIFIHPNQVSNPGSFVRGTVHLNLPRQRSVRSIDVRLTGTCKLPGDKALKLDKEVRTTMDMTERLLPPDYDTVLTAGDHTFDFTFRIPCDAEIAQHSKHGYIDHRVQAVMELSPTTGLFSGNLVSKVKSERERVWIIALTNDPGDTPEPLNMSVEHFSQFLGPIRMEFLSPHLTLSALAHLRIHVVDPPQAVSILSIKSYISQSHQIHYSKNSTSNTPQISVDKFDLLSVDDSDGTPVIGTGWKGRMELKARESRTFSELVRVPPCDKWIAVSTFGPERTIVVNHTLVVEIRYAAAGERMDKFVTIEKPITIASCVALSDTLTLPAYSTTDAKPRIKHSYGCCLCLCDYSLEEVVGVWGDKLKDVTSAVTLEGGLERTVPVKSQRVNSQEDGHLLQT